MRISLNLALSFSIRIEKPSVFGIFWVKDVHLYQNSFIWKEHYCMCQLAMGRRFGVSWEYWICHECIEELVCSNPVLLSLADVCLQMCACCIILVENRLFLGKSRHMASLAVTDFQNAKSLYFVFQMNLVYTTSSFSKFYKQSTVSEVR